jgi:hypothetical protein
MKKVKTSIENAESTPNVKGTDLPCWNRLVGGITMRTRRTS